MVILCDRAQDGQATRVGARQSTGSMAGRVCLGQSGWLTPTRPARPQGGVRHHRPRARSGWLVTSNTGDADVSTSDGVGTWTYADTPRLSTYVAVVNAGPFVELRSTREGFDLGLYARRSLAPMLERDAEELFDLTAKGLTFFGEQFAMPFPQARYDQVFAPSSAAPWRTTAASRGATASSSATHPSYAERERARPGAAARDGAHVVRRHRDHALVGRPLAQRVVRGVGLRVGGRRRAASSPTRGPGCSPPRSRTRTPPTPPPPPTRSARSSPTSRPPQASFDDITYPKGAAVLKQLVAYVGEDAFVAGLRSYFRSPRLGKHHARRPDRRARHRQRPRPDRLGRGLARDLRHRPAHARASTTTA